jgi:hypothetical protein
MTLLERMDQFNKRWNITSQDSYEDSFRKFKTRILNVFKDIDHYVSEQSIRLFCQYYGIKEEWHSDYLNERFWSTNIENRLREESDEIEFYRLIELILSLDIRASFGQRTEREFNKRILIRTVVEAIKLSDVNVDIAVKNDDVILYPKGEALLDEELVNTVLSFLYDASNAHFKQALKYYQSGKAVKSAESLRRSLEEFLKFKLGNTKGLSSALSEVQKKLKEDGRDPQVRNIIFQVFTYLDKYFNDNSKHKDGDISDSENEFLIYQTGVLLRYINNNLGS